MTEWQDYIGVYYTLGDAERALDDIWAIPEGRALIESLARYAPNGAYITVGPTNQANLDTGLITLNLDTLSRVRFDTPDGARHTSITETLVHELFHLSHVDRLPQELYKAPTMGPERLRREELAVAFTDYFMLHHFNVPPRGSPSNYHEVEEAIDITLLPQRTMPNTQQMAAVMLEASDYKELALGDLDVPQLPPDITTRLTQR